MAWSETNRRGQPEAVWQKPGGPLSSAAGDGCPPSERRRGGPWWAFSGLLYAALLYGAAACSSRGGVLFSTGSVQRRRSPRGCLRPRAPSGARPPSRCVAVTSVWLRCSLVLLFVQWAHLRLLRSYFNHLFWPQLRWVSGRAASAPRFLQFTGGGSFRGRVIHSPAFDVPAVFTCIYTWRPWC